MFVRVLDCTREVEVLEIMLLHLLLHHFPSHNLLVYGDVNLSQHQHDRLGLNCLVNLAFPRLNLIEAIDTV